MQHQDFVACVVGLSNNHKESFGTRPGVGKSCLCFRFTYPGYDRYIDTHPSILALHEFGSPVVNNTHFLYWGSPVRTYSVRGSNVNVRYHLLEHTVFYQDITSHPFNALTHPDEVNYYLKKIVGSIESSGKHSYFSRDEILSSSSSDYNKLQYPSNLSKQMRGYIVAFDVSLAETELEMQCKRVVPIIEFLCKTKRKLVIAATKRDIYKIMSLEKARELHRKFHVPLVEVSASENLNVDEVFRLLSKQVLGKKVNSLTDQIQSYDEAARCNLHYRGATKRAFLAFMKKEVINCDERLDPIKLTGAYKECEMWIGAYQAGSLFVHHQLQLYNTRVDSYAGVIDDPDMRREFLEGYVDSRYDMRRYKTELRRWIDNHIEELKQMMPPEPIPYQIFQPTSKVEQDGGVLPPEGAVVPEVTMVPEETAVPKPDEPPSVDSERPSVDSVLQPSTATDTVKSSSSLNSLDDDHDYLNFDPKNPLLHPALSVRDSNQAPPDPVVQISVQTSSPATEMSFPAMEMSSPTMEISSPTMEMSSPEMSSPTSPAMEMSSPSDVGPSSTSSYIQPPSSTVQTSSLTGEANSIQLSSESLPTETLTEPLKHFDNQRLRDSAFTQEGTGNGTGDKGVTENGFGDQGVSGNGTSDEGNRTGSEGVSGNGTSDEGVARNGTDDKGVTGNGKGTDVKAHAERAEGLKSMPPPLVLPKPGKSKMILPQCSTPPGSPSTPRGKAPPPPTRVSSVNAAAKLEESQGNEETRSKDDRQRPLDTERGVSQDEPTSPTSKSLGRKPSRVAPPRPATKRTQSPVFSPTSKTDILIPAKRKGLVTEKEGTRRSTSSSGSSSPVLTSISESVSSRTATTAGEEGDKVHRPMLSKIKQMIAEKKDMEASKESAGEVVEKKASKELAGEVVEKKASKELAGEVESVAETEVGASKELVTRGEGKLAEIRKRAEMRRRLASQKQATDSSDTSVPVSPPSASPARTATLSTVLPSHPPPSQSDDSDAAPPLPPLPPRTVVTLEVSPKPVAKALPSKANITEDNETGDISTAVKIPVPTAQKPETKGQAVSGDISKKATKASFFGWGLKDKLTSPKRTKISPKRAGEKSPKKKGSASPNISPEKMQSRAKFLNMSVRPLPPLPGHCVDVAAIPDHSEEDYEQFSLGTMDDSYVNYPQPLRIGGNSSSVRRWSSFGSNDHHHVAFKPRSLDIPDYIDGYVNTDGVPRPSIGRADWVPDRPSSGKADGVPRPSIGRAESIPSSNKGLMGIDRRPLPKIPDESKDSQEDKKGEEEEEEEVDYDYPNLHGAVMFRSLPATKEWVSRLREKAKLDNMPKNIVSLLHDSAQSRLKNENEAVNLSRTYSYASSDYVPMDGRNEDPDYVNDLQNSSWLPPTAEHFLTTTSQQPESLRPEGEKQYAVDDVSIYMNLPTPERTPIPLPTRSIHATLPRR